MKKPNWGKPWFSRVFPSNLPIQRRLPLLICVLLLVLISTFTLVSYIGVRQTSFEVASERLNTISDQLRSMFEQSSKVLLARTRAVAEKEAIKNILVSNGNDSTAVALKELEKLRTDTITPLIELLNTRKESILRSPQNGFVINVKTDSALLAASRSPELFLVGNFVQVRDSVYYPIIGVVVDQKKPIGYIIAWRKLIPNPRSVEGISKLLGTDATIFFGNDNGSFWTDMVKPVNGPPSFPAEFNKVISYSRARTKPVFAIARPLANSKWVMLLEFPQRKVFESANEFLYWILGVGTILILVGMFLAWLMSRNITKPLIKLTKASSAIAAGDYSTMVEMERTDELGKLAIAFNAMAAQVRQSQETLEKRANDYKLLFERNPMPMWIISPDSLDFVDVNDAAIRHYGYPREEFLALNSKGLLPKEDVKKFRISKELGDPNNFTIWRHRKKDGKIIYVEMISNKIIYKDKPATIVLANDVTKKLEAESEVARQVVRQQRLITETSIEVQEREREEIGKELHDNINQILASTKLFLGLALEDEKNATPELIKRSHQNIRMAMDEIRHLSQSLVAPSLGDITLVEAIRELVSNVQLGTSLTLEVKQENYDESVIDKEKKLMLYRIVQEQISNIIKHSHAKKAFINLSTTMKEIILKIEDNGIGFDIQKKSGGIGLRNMSNRAGFFNGKVDIVTSPGNGCALIVTIPIKQEEKYYSRVWTKLYDAVSDKT